MNKLSTTPECLVDSVFLMENVHMHNFFQKF